MCGRYSHCISHAPNQNLVLKPGMYPEGALNLRHFSCRTGLNPQSHTSWGWVCLFVCFLLKTRSNIYILYKVQ